MEINSFTKNLLFTTVRILARGPQGESSGTGFLYAAAKYGSSSMVPVLVTNKHVVADATECTIFFIQSANDSPALKEDSVAYRFAINQDGPWVGHPRPDVDVTVMALGPCFSDMQKAGVEPYVKVIPPDSGPRPDSLDQIDAAVSIVFVGYPNGLYDTVNKTPILRRGMTASPIHLDWNGEPQFLIDASVFPGSSGSPVFLEPSPFNSVSGSLSIGVKNPLFIGVVAAVYQRQIDGAIIFANKVPRVAMSDAINLGIVYKWTAIEEAVDALCTKLGISRAQLDEAPEPEAQITKASEL